MPTLHQVDPDIFVIKELFSAAICESWIARAEEAGFEPASVRTETGPKMMPQIRDNERVTLSDPELAATLWEAIAAMAPAIDGRIAVGVDDQLRFYRYTPGQIFRRHKDGFVENEAGLRSELSYLLFLNDDFDGGATTFRDYEGRGENRQKHETAIQPEAGMALLFRHARWHEGSRITASHEGRNRKYVLRTDVFFSAESTAQQHGSEP